MKIYRTTHGMLVEQQGRFHPANVEFDDLVRSTTHNYSPRKASGPRLSLRPR